MARTDSRQTGHLDGPKMSRLKLEGPSVGCACGTDAMLVLGLELGLSQVRSKGGWIA